MTTRNEIIDRARAYLRTPFKHQARRLGLGPSCGVDCVGLVLCVGEDFGLIDRNGKPFGRNDYPDYGMEPNGSFVHDECEHRLVKKLRSAMQHGDIVTMRIPIEPCHAGFIANRGGVFYLIHAYNGGQKEVTEHILDRQWARRITGVFSFWGVTD